MTRTNVMASGRPQAAVTAMTRSGSSRARRRLMILPVVLALALVTATPAFAATARRPDGYSKLASDNADDTQQRDVAVESNQDADQNSLRPRLRAALRHDAARESEHVAVHRLRPPLDGGRRAAPDVAGGSIMVMQRRRVATPGCKPQIEGSNA